MRCLVPLLLLAALAGCGGARHASPPPAPTLASTCGTMPAGLRARTSWLRASDGTRIYSASAGSGDTVVVLAHESGGQGLCGWLPTMRWLAAHGLRSMAFDYRGTYPSPLPRRAVEHDWWRDTQAAIDAAGAKNLVLMGASFGGAEAVADAWRLHGVDGVVSLSGELELPSTGIDAIGHARQLRVPLLVVASRLDGYLDAEDARRLVRRAGATDKEVALFPGRAHGWQILDTEPDARRLVLAWVMRRS